MTAQLTQLARLAQLMILPRVWACAPGVQAAPAERPHLQLVVKATAERSPQQHKGPHRLRLVQAVAEMRAAGNTHAAQQVTARAAAPAGPILLRRQPPAVAGVSYEFYRRYTEAMLRRYVKLSMEAGRVPSLLGRELFRGHVSSYKVESFEDVSNFVIDVTRCLKKLDPGQQHLVRRIALEEYTQEETAAMLGMSLRTVIRRYREAIDRLTRILLERGMMQPLTAADVAGVMPAKHVPQQQEKVMAS